MSATNSSSIPTKNHPLVSSSSAPRNSSGTTITSTANNASTFREKYVVLIETIFNYKDDTNKPFEREDVFWDELFLLKINSGFLENSIVLQSEEELIQMEQTILNPLCLKCLFYMNDDSPIRRANAIHTLCIIFKGLFSKRWNNFSVRIMSLVCGFQNADEFFKILLTKSCQLLSKDVKKVKQMVLALFIILLTGADNANQNAIIDYFTLVDVFDPLLNVIEDSTFSLKMKKNAIICISLLCNYRKYEISDNKYISHITSIQKPSAMIALADMITSVLFVWNEAFEQTIQQQSLVSYVWSSIFGSSSNDTTKKARGVNETSGSLLLFYELANHNNDFVGSMTRSLAQMSHEPQDVLSKNIKDQLDQMQKTKVVKSCPLIFQEFLKFCSVLFQEPFYTTKYVAVGSNSKSSEDITSQYYTHFCLLIILCLIEKKVFKKYIFDINTKLDFFLFKKENGVFVKNQYHGFGTVAKILMELLIDFVFHHLQRKHFPVDLTIRALSAIHLLICQSRKYRVRFAVDWDTLWNALTKICDIVAKDECSKDLEKASLVLEKVLKLFNLGILKGEAFLPTRKHHEQMIYQFIRHSSVFDQLTDWIERNLKKVNPNRQLMTNISTIISQIGEEIDLKHGSYPSEDQVYLIIKQTYPNLKLTDFQTLEDVDEYVENPNETNFFTQLMRVFIFDCKTLVNNSFLSQKNN